MIRFEWDDKKAEENWRNHRVSFEDAQLVFSDPNCITELDDRYEYYEDRYWSIGIVDRQYLMLFVVHTLIENEDVIRIITARKAEPHERRLYDNRKL
jgi:uncharacterized DUF497 family protein